MNLEIKIFSEINDFTNVCSHLQSFNKKSQHIKPTNDEGMYPIVAEGKYFYQNSIDSAIEFLEQNARCSKKHKKIALKTIYILKGVYYNKKEISEKLEKSLSELIRLKKRKRSSSTDRQCQALEDIRESKKSKKEYPFTFFCQNDEEVKVDPSIVTQLPFFNTLSENWTKTIREENKFDIKLFSKDALEIVLYSFYGITFPENISLQNLICAYSLADFFLLEEVKNHIGKTIGKNPDNYIDGLIFIYEEIRSFSLDSEEKGEEKDPSGEELSIVASLPFLQQCYLHQIIFHTLSFPNHQKAQEIIPYFEAFAEQNDAFAQTCLAHSYAHGLGLEQNEEKAVEFYTKASEQGYAPAQNNLAFFYHAGFGVDKDPNQAFELFTKASEQGYAPLKKIFQLVMS